MVAVGDYTNSVDNYDNRPHCLFSLTKTIGTGSVTAVDFGIVYYNFGGLYSSGNTVTILEDGVYEIGLALRFATNATGVRQARISKNAVTDWYYDEKAALSGQNTMVHIVIEDLLDAGDDIQFMGYQTSGGNLALASTNRAWVRQVVAT